MFINFIPKPFQSLLNQFTDKSKTLKSVHLFLSCISLRVIYFNSFYLKKHICFVNIVNSNNHANKALILLIKWINFTVWEFNILG